MEVDGKKPMYDVPMYDVCYMPPVLRLQARGIRCCGMMSWLSGGGVSPLSFPG